MVSYPTSFGVWASVLQLIVVEVHEMVIAGNDAFHVLHTVLNRYIPNKILQATQTDQPTFPLLKGKFKEGSSLFFLCKNYTCEAPFFNLKTFFAKL